MKATSKAIDVKRIMTDRPLEVLVVGAGIAGLSVAIALGKQGHRVVVSIAAQENNHRQVMEILTMGCICGFRL